MFFLNNRRTAVQKKKRDAYRRRAKQARSQDFSHGAKTRLLTRFSCRFYHLLYVVCLKHGLQRGGGSRALQDPPPPLAMPLLRPVKVLIAN